MPTRTKPQFRKASDDLFYQRLKEKVSALTRRHARSARRTTWLKLLAYPSIYIAAYCLLLING